VVAHLALGQDQDHGLALLVTHDVELGISPPLMRPMQRERPLFSVGWRPFDAL
jgi:hypothetical protein